MEDCTTSDSSSILDAFFEGPYMFTVIGDPISDGHNILTQFVFPFGFPPIVCLVVDSGGSGIGGCGGGRIT